MMDNHSDREWIYRSRHLAPVLRDAVKDHPVVVLTGARQVGKSTLLQEEAPFNQWRYVTLDDFDALSRAEQDPSGIWAGADHVVLEEVQKAPPMLSAVKQAVDQRRRQVRFILSGSANLLLMRNVAESLAGRAVHFSLLPMSDSESRGRPPSGLLAGLIEGRFPGERACEDVPEEPFTHMVRGFLPPVLTLPSAAAATRWWEGYVSTYLERDLRSLSQVESLTDYRTVMESLALRSGQMLNQTEVARDTRVSQSTVHRYLNLMEVSCLLTRLPAFTGNRTKRLIKTPKVYWVDPGLAAHLSGHYDAQGLASSREAGGIFETLVLLHLQVFAQRLLPRARLAYWRTTSGKEVDFVLEQGKRIVALECKLAATARYSDTAGLRAFLDEYPETAAGVLVYTGRSIVRLDEKIVALPWAVTA